MRREHGASIEYVLERPELVETQSIAFIKDLFLTHLLHEITVLAIVALVEHVFLVENIDEEVEDDLRKP